MKLVVFPLTQIHAIFKLPVVGLLQWPVSAPSAIDFIILVEDELAHAFPHQVAFARTNFIVYVRVVVLVLDLAKVALGDDGVR